MDGRQQRGCAIAATMRIQKNRLGWKVPSQTGSGSYVVNLEGEPICTCPDFETRNAPCKHIFAVEFTIRRESAPDGTISETQTVRVTYRQDWPAYNAAQVHEKEHFVELLDGLCAGIEQPPQARGRPRLPLRDVVLAAALKVYSTRSGRRAVSEFREALAKGHLSRVPHYNSVFNYLDTPALTPILKGLIEESASPLRAVETDFAVDSSGFTTASYVRWFDHKHGKMRSEHSWLKAHVMVGVKTNVVTSLEVTDGDVHDYGLLPPLVQATARRFGLAEVAADKGYTGRSNLEVISKTGAVPYIPFKSHTTGKGPDLWKKLWHFYHFNREEFLAHYHKRSNVETTFSMIKGKFGASIRSKAPTAQRNEVMLKVLCHNVCVLVQSIYELGIEPTFWAPRPIPASRSTA